MKRFEVSLNSSHDVLQALTQNIDAVSELANKNNVSLEFEFYLPHNTPQKHNTPHFIDFCLRVRGTLPDHLILVMHYYVALVLTNQLDLSGVDFLEPEDGLGEDPTRTDTIKDSIISLCEEVVVVKHERRFTESEL